MLLKLKAFIATADAGNFSEAARNSYVTPSVIMKRVDELEWDFKTTLFVRSTRRLTLTDTGQSYLTHARQLVQSYNDMVSGAILSPGSIAGPINDADYLCAAACDGQGIVQLARPTVADALQTGRLVTLLEQFPLVERWVKVMVPSARLQLVRVKLLFDRMALHLASG